MVKGASTLVLLGESLGGPWASLGWPWGIQGGSLGVPGEPVGGPWAFLASPCILFSSIVFCVIRVWRGKGKHVGKLAGGWEDALAGRLGGGKQGCRWWQAQTPPSQSAPPPQMEATLLFRI